jgi:hypothetical protein
MREVISKLKKNLDMSENVKSGSRINRALDKVGTINMRYGVIGATHYTNLIKGKKEKKMHKVIDLDDVYED